jgi:hypothetical protein
VIGLVSEPDELPDDLSSSPQAASNGAASPAAATAPVPLSRLRRLIPDRLLANGLDMDRLLSGPAASWDGGRYRVWE